MGSTEDPSAPWSLASPRLFSSSSLGAKHQAIENAFENLAESLRHRYSDLEKTGEMGNR